MFDIFQHHQKLRNGIVASAPSSMAANAVDPTTLQASASQAPAAGHDLTALQTQLATLQQENAALQAKATEQAAVMTALETETKTAKEGMLQTIKSLMPESSDIQLQAYASLSAKDMSALISQSLVAKQAQQAKLEESVKGISAGIPTVVAAASGVVNTSVLGTSKAADADVIQTQKGVRSEAGKAIDAMFANAMPKIEGGSR